MLSDAENTEEKTSSEQKCELLLSDSSVSSDDKNEYNDVTGTKDNSCNGDNNGRGVRNTG